MPWCENEECQKRGLKKDEVVFNEKNRKVLCVPCGQAASVLDGELVTELLDKTWFGIGYTSDQGLKAELIHGGARLAFGMSNDQIMKLLSP